MDSTQLAITIVIPFIVSIIVWMLTYIAPYIVPSQLSNIILVFTKSQNPRDQFEIGLFINQYLKYDDWKRLTAKGRLKQIFIRKMNEIEEYQENKWIILNENTISMPIKDVINHFNQYLSQCRDFRVNKLRKIPKTICIHPMEITEHLEKDNKEWIANKIEMYSAEYDKHENAKVWFYLDKNLKKCDGSLKKYIANLSSFEVVQLADTKYSFIDWDGLMDEEHYFRNELKEKRPTPLSNEELNTIFDDIMFYIDYPHHDSKKDKIIPSLALGLSGHPKSCETLLEIIKEIKNEINLKDLEEGRKKWKHQGYL